jgi:hypothetical protein
MVIWCSVDRPVVDKEKEKLCLAGWTGRRWTLAESDLSDAGFGGPVCSRSLDKSLPLLPVWHAERVGRRYLRHSGTGRKPTFVIIRLEDSTKSVTLSENCWRQHYIVFPLQLSLELIRNANTSTWPFWARSLLYIKARPHYSSSCSCSPGVC